MDTLLKVLAVLTLIWGGWMYVKSADEDAELKRIRNELKLTEQELANTRATYEEKDKERETLAREVAALKEGNQELRKAIAAKREEKRKRISQERQERLEAERKAREEEREARIKQQRQRLEDKMAQLESDRQYEREEEERKKTERVRSEAVDEMDILQTEIETGIQWMERYIKCSAYAPSGTSDYRRVESLKRRWTSHVQASIEALKNGDSESFEKTGKRLINLSKSIDYICGDGCTADATSFINEGRKVLELQKHLAELLFTFIISNR